MKPRYEENIEILAKLDGSLLCVLSWRHHTFQEELPRACDTWPIGEFRRYLKIKVIPKLRLQLLQAQKAHIEATKDVAEAAACLPEKVLDQRDVDTLAKAQAKRERKAVKLKVLSLK